ncbi:acyl-CoA thioesterase [Hymenobacter endophyticus]|uniref:Thioesterase family protein n=1 Tax=Hymenobacter endophyticus TaxID=3076335 RepID=A0ABU3TC34_9BACT|nr:thioesterase family protein [Hymenobacter endophyticus]MDU0368915.1 thioesterase family protein [Hymenobacter endophyticus]
MENVPLPAFRFSRLLTVQADDIDELNHVNNVRYVQWVQDTAAAHWQAAAPPEAQQRYVWVVREHHIRYLHPALLSQQLRCTTWVSSMEGVTSHRHVRIERAEDNKLLCEAETHWILLDPGTMRPQRIPAEMARWVQEAV